MRAVVFNSHAQTIKRTKAAQYSEKIRHAFSGGVTLQRIKLNSKGIHPQFHGNEINTYNSIKFAGK